MRREAWNAVVRTKWLWRLALVTMLLNAVAQLVLSLVSDAYSRMGITTWTEFGKAKIAAAQGGLGYTSPSAAVSLQMTGASLFEVFITYIFSAIFALGIATATLKAIRDDEKKWLAISMEGFRRPLESAWLLFLINFKVFLWSLLFVVPGIVAAYRYRQAWFIKARHHEWPASRCIARSCEIMDGFKWKAFVFDLSYWGWLLLIGLTAGVSIVSANSIAIAFSTVGAIFVSCYFFAGRAVFYRELCNATAGGTTDNE
jgi:hypothetical protein